MAMKKLAAAKFKEQCLSILDHLEPEGLVITKHGKPVARILLLSARRRILSALFEVASG